MWCPAVRDGESLEGKRRSASNLDADVDAVVLPIDHLFDARRLAFDTFQALGQTLLILRVTGTPYGHAKQVFEVSRYARTCPGYGQTEECRQSTMVYSSRG